MSQSFLLENTYGEDLYSVPPKTVIAISVPWVSLTDSEKLLLEKILNSVKLSINHVKIVTTQEIDVLNWGTQPKCVLAFGLEMHGFNQFEPFQVRGIDVILSPSLTKLDQDKDGKQKLWVALKKIFI